MVGETADKCNVLIVMGDGRYGSMLERFLCQMHTREFSLIAGLVDARYRETRTSSRDIRSGGDQQQLPDICKVEYMDFERFYAGSDNELKRILGEYSIDWLCLVPFGNTFRRPEHVECFLRTYKRNRGRNVLLLSSVGAESARVPLGDLRACEDKVRTEFPTMNCTLRMQCPLEDFDYFSEAVRSEKTWKLPCGDGSFAPVAFRDDVVFAAATVMKAKSIEWRHSDQIYTLTGGIAVNGITLAQMTCLAFDEYDVKFVAATSEEAKQIMNREIEKRKRKTAGANGAEPGVGGPGDISSIGGIDIEYTSGFECDMILNRFELVKDHQLNFVTTHVRDVTGHEPEQVPTYLRSHEGSFKPKGRCSKRI